MNRSHQRPLSLAALVVAALCALAWSAWSAWSVGGAPPASDAAGGAVPAAGELAARARHARTTAQAVSAHSDDGADVARTGATAPDAGGDTAVGISRPSAVGITPSSARRRLHALWQRERADAQWTREAREFLTESAAAAGVEIGFEEPVSCRQNVCRTVLSAADFGALAELGQMSWDKPVVGFPLPGADGQVRYELYVARPGSELAAIFAGQKALPSGGRTGNP